MNSHRPAYGVLLYAGLLEIPEDVLEAARIDGANSWHLIRRVILPHHPAVPALPSGDPLHLRPPGSGHERSLSRHTAR